jgi:ABC-type glycerol-3-phosphate transport system substrate-binding protein
MKSVVRMFGFTLLASLLGPPLFGAGVTVRLTGEPGGEGGRYQRALAEAWAEKTGNKVEYIFRPLDVTAALQVYSQYWASKSPDIDVYQIDVFGRGSRPLMQLI